MAMGARAHAYSSLDGYLQMKYFRVQSIDCRKFFVVVVVVHSSPRTHPLPFAERGAGCLRVILNLFVPFQAFVYDDGAHHSSAATSGSQPPSLPSSTHIFQLLF